MTSPEGKNLFSIHVAKCRVKAPPCFLNVSKTPREAPQFRGQRIGRLFPTRRLEPRHALPTCRRAPCHVWPNKHHINSESSSEADREGLGLSLSLSSLCGCFRLTIQPAVEREIDVLLEHLVEQREGALYHLSLQWHDSVGSC